MDRSKNDIRLDVAMNANDWSKLAAVLVLVVAFLLLLCSTTNDTTSSSSFVLPLPLLVVAMDFTLLYIFLQAERFCSTECDGFSMRIE